MFKFIITRVTDTERENRWAYLIDDTDECKRFFKNNYDFDVEKRHCGRWFVCIDDMWWTCQPDKFAHYYRIIDVIKEEKTAIDFHGKEPTCAGMHTGECICSTEEHTTESTVPDCPEDICVSYSKDTGFFMNVNFKEGKEDDIPEKTYSKGASVSEAVSFACDAFSKFGKNVSECVNDIAEAMNVNAKVSDYRDVVFKDTFAAGLVLKNMRNIVDTLGFVSVADCCHLVGALIHFGDHDIGWTNISKAMVIPVTNGFIIKYPEPSSRTQPNCIEREPRFQLRKVYYRSNIEASRVRDDLRNIIRANGYATVADYYCISNVDASPEEVKRAREYGWKDIGVARIEMCVPNKFKLDIREPERLNLNPPNEANGLD